MDIQQNCQQNEESTERMSDCAYMICCNSNCSFQTALGCGVVTNYGELYL